PSTDYEVLEQLAAMGHEVPRLLIEYRELSKLKSTYVDALPAFINPVTGRIHTSFNQTGAATGRLSSSDPNLQNIPVRTPRGEAIRRCPGLARWHRGPGSGEGVCRDTVRKAALCPGAQGPQLQHPRVRGADRDELPASGIGG